MTSDDGETVPWAWRARGPTGVLLLLLLLVLLLAGTRVLEPHLRHALAESGDLGYPLQVLPIRVTV